MPTDLPATSARKRKAQAQTRTDIMVVVRVWAIILLATLVLVQLLGEQSFSNPTTEWEYIF
jgi:hypothetical protein